MHRIIACLLLVVLLAVAFYGGRWTADPPRFQAASERVDAGSESALDAAWSNFLRSQSESLALMQGQDFYDDEQARAEAYRVLFYGLVGAIKSSLLDVDQPRFMKVADWSSKNGLDNPDNVYYVARVRDTGQYLIKGNTGNTAGMVFQVVEGQPGVGNAGTSKNVSVLYAKDMLIDDNGDFEVVVGRSAPTDGQNWLPLKERAESILVRYTHGDWSDERAGRVYIRPARILGDRSSNTSELELLPLDEATMADTLNLTAQVLYDRTATWLDYSKKSWAAMPRNGVSKARASRGGLAQQYSAFGSWQLNDEQALILRVKPSAASYQGIELGSLWFVSLDYENRTSSLTTEQAYLSSDGFYYFVISQRDPGIQNWLDPEHHPRGLIMMRWQGLLNDLPDDQQPVSRLVSFDELRAELPADTPGFDPIERSLQRAIRREHVHLR